MSLGTIARIKEKYILSIVTILSSAAIASLVCVTFFFQQNFKLEKLPSFAIGDALLAGVDSPKRQTVYYAMILLFVITYIISQKIIRYALTAFSNKFRFFLDFFLYVLLFSSVSLLTFIPFYLSGSYISQYQCIFFNISVCAFSLILFKLVYSMHQTFIRRFINLFYWTLFFLVITTALQISIFIRTKDISLTFYSHAIQGVMVGIFLLVICSLYLKKRGKMRLLARLAPKRYINISLFIIIASAEFIIHSLINASNPISLFGTSKYAFFASLFCFLGCFIIPAFIINCRKTCIVLSPFVIAPFFYTFCSEVQFFLTKWFFIPTYVIYNFSLLFLLIISLVIWWFRPKIKMGCLLKYWYYPIIILTVYTATLWAPASTLNGLDTLHPGNVLATPQQMLSFGKVPYIDFWPGRGVYDSFLSLAYALAWQTSTDWVQICIPRIFQHPLLGCMLFYVLFTFFYRPTISFLVCISFICVLNPIYSCMASYYPSSLIILITLLSSVPGITTMKVTATWLSCVFVFILHAASGTFGAYALLCTYFTLFYKKLKYFLKILIIGLIIFLAILALVAFLPFDRPLMDLAYDLYYTSVSDFLIGSYRFVFNNNYITFFEVNILLPFLCILTILIFSKVLSLSPNQNWSILRAKIAVIFLSFFSLFSLTRTLARHCVFESANLTSFDYFIILLFYPAIFPIFRRHIRSYLTGLFILILFFSPMRLNFAHTMKIYSWSEDSLERVRFNNPSYSNVAAFLKNNLHGDETFLTNSDAPMFYVASDKPFPAFQPAMMLVQSLPAQRAYVKQLNKLYKEGNLPIALLKNNPRELYYILPWVYTRYIPFTIIDGLQIWLANTSRLAKELIISPMKIPPQHEDWELLAGIFGATLESQHQLKSSSNEFVEVPLSMCKFSITPENSSKDGVFVVFKILASEGATIRGSVRSENSEGSFTFTVEPTPEARWIALPLKSLYAFFENPTAIWLQTDKAALVNLRPIDPALCKQVR